MIYLQNKVTGAIEEVEPNSQEFYDKVAERTPENKPVWEQQGDHAVAARIERAEAGELRSTDLPKESQSQIVDERNEVSKWRAEREPWKNRTDAERALGITKESKLAGERQQINTEAQDANAATRADAAKTILASDTSRRKGDPVAADVPTGTEGGSEGDDGDESTDTSTAGDESDEGGE